MNYSYSKCSMQEIEFLIEEYANTLSSPFDSFLEDHIATSDFYKIAAGENLAGYFAFNSEAYITQFYLRSRHYKHSHRIFNEVLEQYKIKHALVYTGDELFLSLVLDQEISLKKQAYFFQDSKLEIQKTSLYQDGVFRKAVEHDIPLILSVSGDFFDSLDSRVQRGEIFVFLEGEELLGAGIIEHGRVMKGHTSIGMFTNEEHRQKGIGRTIIYKLKQWCYDNNRIPICGCWYYNHNSKKTLESAGMITKTRLLNIEFLDYSINQ